nr:hypothetical protein [Rhizobium gallicum]
MKTLYKGANSRIRAANHLWESVENQSGDLFSWDASSTYLRFPPYVDIAVGRPQLRSITAARALLVLGDSVTTDHISPVGRIALGSPAAEYLERAGVCASDFNTYGARRCNADVMVRGTFANPKLKNMIATQAGPFARHFPSGREASVFAVAEWYKSDAVPLVIFAGRDYGAGSSRDWAAKGTKLLGVKAVIAQSFERIHRSNLVGMGVMPLLLPEGTDVGALKLTGDETFDLTVPVEDSAFIERVELSILRKKGRRQRIALRPHVESALELQYLRSEGLFPHMLNKLWNSDSEMA